MINSPSGLSSPLAKSRIWNRGNREATLPSSIIRRSYTICCCCTVLIRSVVINALLRDRRKVFTAQSDVLTIREARKQAMETITAEYLEEQRRLHHNPNYGIASFAWGEKVGAILHHLAAQSMTDYGAGKKNLKKALDARGIGGYAYQAFDPAFPQYGQAVEADLVCCIDVLEHVEPHLLDNVLLDLKRITKTVGFFTVHTGPAAKTLSDGRNAHLIQKPATWWLTKLADHFQIGYVEHYEGLGKGFAVVVGAKLTSTEH